MCLIWPLPSGNVHNMEGMADGMEDLLTILPKSRRLYITGADIGFCGDSYRYALRKVLINHIIDRYQIKSEMEQRYSVQCRLPNSGYN